MIDEIEGWLPDKIAAAMRELIIETKPFVCVEIGVFHGKSLINTALALRENKHGVVYGIDPWKNDESVRNVGTGDTAEYWASVDLDSAHVKCMENIWKHNLDKFAIVIRAASQNCDLLFHYQSIDILYIDGGHSERQSCLDAFLYQPCVKSGGYIWCDDADWQSTQKAQDYILQFCKLVQDYGQARLYKKQ